jgi:hypothetical protein
VVADFAINRGADAGATGALHDGALTVVLCTSRIQFSHSLRAPGFVSTLEPIKWKMTAVRLVQLVSRLGALAPVCPSTLRVYSRRCLQMQLPLRHGDARRVRAPEVGGVQEPRG